LAESLKKAEKLIDVAIVNVHKVYVPVICNVGVKEAIRRLEAAIESLEKAIQLLVFVLDKVKQARKNE